MYVKRKYILYGVVPILLVLAYVVCTFRVEIGTWWWRTTYTLPSAVLLVTQDASLAHSMGNYYFEPTPEWGTYDIARAEHFYKQAVRLDPEFARSWFQLARISFITGDFETSLARVDKHLALGHGSTSGAYYLRGLVHGFGGRIDESIHDFERYLSLGVSAWFPYNNLAWLYFQQGEYASMLRVTEKGLMIAPDNPWLLMSAGVSYYNLGQYEQALPFLDRAESKARFLTEEDWSSVYPGNDPEIAREGLREFKENIERNKMLVQNALGEAQSP